MASSPLTSTGSPPRKILARAARHSIAAGLCAAWIAAAAAAHARTLDARSQQAIQAALAALRGADLIVVDDPVPGRAPSALLATRAAASPAALAATLGDPRAYSDAIPSLVRADVVDRRPSASGAGIDQLIDWELEIPLFNLRGKAWVRPRADGVDLILAEGDLAPGQLAFTWIPGVLGHRRDAGAGIAGQHALRGLDLPARRRAQPVRRRGNERHRRLRRAARRGRAGAASGGSTRAPAARRPHAARASGADRRRQRARVEPGARRVSCARRGRGDTARTRRPPRGGVGRGADRARRRPAGGAPHRARELAGLPGLAPRKGAGRRPHRHRRQPAARRLRRRLAARARPRARLHRDRRRRRHARRDVRVGRRARATRAARDRSVAVLSLYPRLETSGYVPRKFIAAEPLLEHGMSLAVGYADAMSMARALATTR